MASTSKSLKTGFLALLILMSSGCSKIGSLVKVSPIEEQKLQALSTGPTASGDEADREVTDIYRYLVAQKLSFEGHSDRAAALFKKMLVNSPNSVEILNAAALEEINLSHFDEGLALLERAIALDPNNRMAMEAKARVLSEKGDFSTALTIYGKLLNENPDDEDLLDAMVQIFVAREDFVPAERLIHTFLQKNPGSEYALFRLGMIQRASGRVQEARKTLESLLDSIPDSYQAAAQLARVYDDLGEKAKALELYEWLARSTNNPNYHWILALMYTEMKRFDDAIRAFENLEKTKPLDDQTKLMMLSVKAHQQVDLKNVQLELQKMVAKSPENESIKVILAEVYQMDGKDDEALGILSRIDRKDRNYTEALSSRLKLLLQTKKTDDLRELLDSIDVGQLTFEKNSERQPRLFAEIGYYYSKIGEFAKAHSALDKGQKLSPKNDQLQYMRGLVFEKENKTEQAVNAMEAVILLNPKHAPALNFVGYSLAEQGVKLEKAENYIRRALAENPDDPYMLDSLGWVLFRRGRLQDALTELSKAQEALPRESIVASHLGDVYLRLGKPNEARRLFKMALELGPDKESEREVLENKIATLDTSEPPSNRLPSENPSGNAGAPVPCEGTAPPQTTVAATSPCIVQLRDPKSP
jgi:tetratricopeptide (TPR) repeat protein